MTNLDFDSKVDRNKRENRLNQLYEEHIMDRSHLQNLVFDEIFDNSLPVYDNLCIRISSPDLQRVESYTKYLYDQMEKQNIDLEETYPLPHRVREVNNLNLLNSKELDKIELEEYTRIIQLNTLPAVCFPIVMMMLKSTQPEGVKTSIGYYNEALKWERFQDPLEIPENMEMFGDIVDEKRKR